MLEKTISDFVEGCQICEEYRKKSFSEITSARKCEAYGVVLVGDVAYGWLVTESFTKAAEKHYIFTTFTHHVGEDMQKVRAALNAQATRMAEMLLGLNYRMINDSGSKACTLAHYHCHLISSGKGERLPRVVTNVQEVIRNLDVSDGLRTSLDIALLQQE